MQNVVVWDKSIIDNLVKFPTNKEFIFSESDELLFDDKSTFPHFYVCHNGRNYTNKELSRDILAQVKRGVDIEDICTKMIGARILGFGIWED